MEAKYDGTYLTMRGEGKHRQMKLTNDEMISICAAFTRYNRERMEAREAELRSAGQIYTARYARHHLEEKVEYTSLDEALAFLKYGSDDSQLVPISITIPNGSVIEGKLLAEMIDDHE